MPIPQDIFDSDAQAFFDPFGETLLYQSWDATLNGGKGGLAAAVMLNAVIIRKVPAVLNESGNRTQAPYAEIEIARKDLASVTPSRDMVTFAYRLGETPQTMPVTMNDPKSNQSMWYLKVK